MTKKSNFFHPPKDDQLKSLTGAPLASFTRRAAALFIDFLIAGILFLLLAIGGAKVLQWIGVLTIEKDVNLQFTFFKNWYSIAWLVAYFTLSVYFSNGQTLGKALCKIRIVSTVHDHIGFWHALERALGYGASILEAGFGFFQYFLRPDRRTIHDRIAETIVVDESEFRKLKDFGERKLDNR